MIKRNFTGIGNHSGSDQIFVSAWKGLPLGSIQPNETEEQAENRVSRTFAGTFGGVLGFPELFLDSGMRCYKLCARWGESCTSWEDNCEYRKGDLCNPPRFKFSMDISIEPMYEEDQCQK